MNAKMIRSELYVWLFALFALPLLFACQKERTSPEEGDEVELYDYVIEARAENDRSKKGIYRGIIRNKHGFGQFKVNFMNDSEQAYVVVSYENQLDTLRPTNLMPNPDDLPFDLPTNFVGERFSGHFRVTQEGRNPLLQVEFLPTYQGNPVTDHRIFLGRIAKERSDLKIFPLKGTFSVAEGVDSFIPGTLDGIMLEQADPAVVKYRFEAVMMQEDAEYGNAFAVNLNGYSYQRPTQGLPIGQVVSALFAPPLFTGEWEQERISASGKWETKVVEWF